MGFIEDFYNMLTSEGTNASYKLALLCSIIDYIDANPPAKGNSYQVPIIFVAKQFLNYYLPLTINLPIFEPVLQ